MYHHIKKLMYTVRVDRPDPRFGNGLLEQFGGANGELAAAFRARACRSRSAHRHCARRRESLNSMGAAWTADYLKITGEL